jgi:hypothetical protein
VGADEQPWAPILRICAHGSRHPASAAGGGTGSARTVVHNGRIDVLSHLTLIRRRADLRFRRLVTIG